MPDKEFKHLVRIANTDLDGNLPLYKSLIKIKGVGFMFSNMLCSITKIDKNKKTGTLTEDEAKGIELVIKDPLKFSIPEWMLNRRGDAIDGTSKHLIAADLEFANDNDIKTMKKIRSYKGARHAAGLPVRGQRTKSNFRKNKGKVSLGVKKREGAKTGRS